ncbi:MAG: MFS transporter [Actinomycetota bacterium]
MVGLYVPTWLNESRLRDSALAITEAAAAAVVIVLAPWLGAATDRTGRRLPSLFFTTLLAVGATAALASFSPLATLIILGIGLVGLNLGSALYDALLPAVSRPEDRGRISGIGVGVGYVGSFIGLGLGYLAFSVLGAGYPTTFQLLALGFSLFAIPIFLWVKESEATTDLADRSSPSWTRVITAWRDARETPGVVRFLLGRFLYTDAINTLIGGFLAIFALTELGLDPGQVNGLLALAIASAIAGGLLGGRAVGRLGARSTLRLALLLWVGAIGGAVAVAATGTVGTVWPIGVGGGLALGTTWASDRVLMLELSPPARLGEFYGLYATVGRFATVIGPLAWALIVDGLGAGRNIAMVALAGFVLAGWWVVRR